MKHIVSILMITSLFMMSCIGDDFIFDEIEPTIRILNPLQSLEEGTSYQFEVSYFNNVGIEESVSNIFWSSADPSIIAVDDNGLATALMQGQTTVTAEFEIDGLTIRDDNLIEVSNTTMVENNQAGGSIMTTSSYVLEGDFIISDNGGRLKIEFEDNYKASTALPGLYVYLSNNPNSVAEAHEIGAVEVFEGAHSYDLDDNIGLNDYSHLLYYCKPFNVKVGDGKIE